MAAPGATEKWDAVVVGSGPGGLCTAAYLAAAAARRVLVLEQHDLAGGNCQVFRRHHAGSDFEFDVGIHYLGDCEPGGLIPSILRGVGLEGRIEFNELDPDGFDTLIFPDFTFRVPRGWAEYRERLAARFPDEIEGIDRCVEVLRRLAHEAMSVGQEGVDLSTLMQWGLRPLGDLFEDCGLSPEAVAVLDHVNGLYAGPPSQSSTIMHAFILDHYMRGAFYPKGGGQVISAGLVDVVESHGGEVRTKARVGEIVVTEGRTAGVRLVDGTVIEAPLVVSNADYKRTMLEMLGPEHVSEETRRRAADAVMTLPLVCVYVVIDEDLRGRLPNSNLFVFNGYDVEGHYAGLERGETDNVDFAYLSLASLKDPDHRELCPPGHTNFQIMTLGPRGYGSWGVDGEPAQGGQYRRNPDYRAKKEHYTERLLDLAEQAIGPFRDHVVHIETATPLTQERYTLSSGGTSYGLLHSPDQVGPMRPNYRTEIPGLFLVGANTASGHGVAGTLSGGVQCAGEILGRNLFAEIREGAVLGDPGALPPPHAERDPVVGWRGGALGARGAAGGGARAAAKEHAGVS